MEDDRSVPEPLDVRLARLGEYEDPDELVRLGCDLVEQRRNLDAEGCFRKAAEMGSALAWFNLGNTLVELGRLEEAVEAFRLALDGGEVDAGLNMGMLLEDLGDPRGAEAVYRRAASEGEMRSTLALAFLLWEQGEQATALEIVEGVANRGDDVAAAVVACWRWENTLDTRWESALRAGADHFPSARASLADLLRMTGRIEQAREVLEYGVSLGETVCYLPLGNLYADDLADFEKAERVYRLGVSGGDVNCRTNLAVLLLKKGDRLAAISEFRQAAMAGDELAARHLRELEEGLS